MSGSRKLDRLVSYEDSSDESDVEPERGQSADVEVLETDFFGFADRTGSSGDQIPWLSAANSCLPTGVNSTAVTSSEAEMASHFFPSRVQSAPQATSFDQDIIPRELGTSDSLHPFDYGPHREQICQGTSGELSDEQARKLISKFEAEPFGHSLPDMVHIVDVRVDDYMNDVRENVLRSAKPQTLSSTDVPKDEKDKPTIVAKRKHQITYLAHLAKEREGQLEQQWAQNKQRRREARLKYGF